MDLKTVAFKAVASLHIHFCISFLVPKKPTGLCPQGVQQNLRAILRGPSVSGNCSNLPVRSLHLVNHTWTDIILVPQALLVAYVSPLISPSLVTLTAHVAGDGKAE